MPEHNGPPNADQAVARHDWLVTLLRVLTIAAVALPLAIDTFILGTALGAAGVEKHERLRMSLILGIFEAGMPVVGFLAGAAIGAASGIWSTYLAAAVLAAIGVWMLWPRGAGEADAEDRLRLLRVARGWAIVVLGLSISVDELAIGFGVGLLGLPLVVLVVLIAVQAFLAAQLGMRLGSRMAEGSKHSAERIAASMLVLAAVLVLADKLVPV
jgi:putative Mn2+ efflux pump MntP